MRRFYLFIYCMLYTFINLCMLFICRFVIFFYDLDYLTYYIKSIKLFCCIFQHHYQFIPVYFQFCMLNCILMHRHIYPGKSSKNQGSIFRFKRFFYGGSILYTLEKTSKKGCFLLFKILAFLGSYWNQNGHSGI